MIEIILILAIVYLIAQVNEANYLCRTYDLDMVKLKDKNKREVARVTAELYKKNSFRYTPSTAKGIVGHAETYGQEQIKRRKLKFQHDLVKSFITAITRHLSG